MADIDAADIVPALVAFDLDFTIWQPEMYELWGGGSPFKKCPKTLRVTDRKGVEVTVFEGARQALLELKRHEKFNSAKTLVATVSKTDEPEWARECMKLLELGDGISIMDCIDIHEIYGGNKARHFENLHKKTKIPYEDMLFFDNEQGNIRDVSKLGVVCVFTPDGMQNRYWNEGLEAFRRARKVAKKC